VVVQYETLLQLVEIDVEVLEPTSLQATSCRDVHQALVERETTEVVGLRDGDVGASGMGRRGKQRTVQFIF
jgi:hypothetical protein